MVIIVGGGLTGLACAYQLNLLGAPHLVLEAAEVPGGVIRSTRVSGHLLEAGPQRTRLTEGFRELVRDLGLEGELIRASQRLPLYVYRDGRLRRVPLRLSEFLSTDLLSWRGKLRLLAEPLSRGPRAGESVAAYLTRKLGPEAYEHLVGPLYGGLYGSDPADMQVELSLAHVLRELRIERSLLIPLLRRGGRISAPVACSFRTGMQALPNALYERNRENVRLGTPVRRIVAAGDGGFTVEIEGDRLSAGHLLLCVDAPAAARLLEGVAPAAARAAASLTYNPLAIVHLHAATDLAGLGYQVSLAEQTVTRGVTFNHSLFGRTGVYTAFLGGSRVPEIAAWSDDRLMTTARDEFRCITGFDSEPLTVTHVRMPAWDRSWAALEGFALPHGMDVAANWLSRPGIPGRLLDAKRMAVRLGTARMEDRE